MNLLRLSFGLLLALTVSAGSAQKKAIDHTCYDGWKSISAEKLSNNGKWLSYEINPQVGDGFLYFHETATGKTDSIFRAAKSNFFHSGDHALFILKAPYKVVRQAKLDKKKPEEMPSDSAIVWSLADRKQIKVIPDVKEIYAVEGSARFIVLHKKMKEIPSGKKKKKKKKKGQPEIKSEGRVLEVHDLTVDPNAKKKTFPFLYEHVTEVVQSEKGEAYAFVQQRTVGKKDSSYVYLVRSNALPERIFKGEGQLKSLTFDKKGSQLAMLYSQDTSKRKIYDLFYYHLEKRELVKVADTTTTAFPSGWCVSEHEKLQFSEDGTRLFFGSANRPAKEIKDTLTEDEKYKLDIWSWSDLELQPEQLMNLEKNKKKSYMAVYHIADKKVVQLADEQMDQVRLVNKGNTTVALGISSLKYDKQRSWESPWGEDVYVVDLKTGERKLALENNRFGSYMSPDGKYIAYYNRDEDHWYAFEISSGKSIRLTEAISEDFFEDDNGMPQKEEPCGLMGWSENDAAVFLYDRYDIWKVDLKDPSKPICITQFFGKETKRRFRYIKTDKDEVYIPDSRILLSSFNEVDKNAGFYEYDPQKRARMPLLIMEGPYQINFIAKAKEGEQVIYSRNSFVEYPDVWLTDINFSKSKKVSLTNPQQKDYKWGTVELVHWTSPKGKQLDGLLYKPEDFDSTKKYPMIVYFYEKYSQDMHRHYAPRPTASIVFATEYVSNDYIMFYPDILYDEGSPGENAYDCIVSGTEYILSKGFVNKEKIGIQGQSWGGYQTAYLVTQTNLYRAGMAGAPVSNMTSAYGGIRWGSGLSRMFQYEMTQSRLGVTLWEDRERYIRNSPLFFADKVETPLLIMHNDKDGAVPWYQGIEYFVALRRLNKPAWLLNYNDDDHNLMRRANRMDLSIRMRQFFDHYLQDKPMPIWMKEGLPATKKGIETGYDLSE